MFGRHLTHQSLSNVFYVVNDSRVTVLLRYSYLHPPHGKIRFLDRSHFRNFRHYSNHSDSLRKEEKYITEGRESESSLFCPDIIGEQTRTFISPPPLSFLRVIVRKEMKWI